MNFILLSDYFFPIVKSGSIIVGDLAEELLSQGHKVTLITFEDTQKDEINLEVKNSLQIIRIKSPTRKYGKVGRLWAEINYSRKVIKSIKNFPNLKCDGLICYAPSIFYGSSINWLKKKYTINAYLIIRDIFPKWAFEAGLLRNGLLYRYFKYIEKNLYNSCEVIGIEAKSDLDYFNRVTANQSNKVEVLNNWGSTSILLDEFSSSDLLNPKTINIIYGGNMGDAQDLLKLLNIVDFSILKERAHLFFIGSGNQFEKIKQTIKRKKLTNITLLDSIDRKSYLSIMAEADIGIVSLSSKMSSHNYPLKMIGYMQLGKPILASVNKGNEIISMIQKYNIGFASHALDQNAFNKNLNLLITDKRLRKEQGTNALKLFNEKFNVKVAAKQILKNFYD
jgi:O26-antigen biosynthesis N-acetyl-L-fucosamine transferase